MLPAVCGPPDAAAQQTSCPRCLGCSPPRSRVGSGWLSRGVALRSTPCLPPPPTRGTRPKPCDATRRSGRNGREPRELTHTLPLGGRLCAETPAVFFIAADG